jgi:hypothetical protein
MAAYGPSPPKLSFSRWPLIDHLLPRAYVDVSSLAMTLAAVRIDVGPQHGIHAGQMPVALLLEPLETRRCTDVLPGGTTTRARFQNLESSFGPSGASARVLSLPSAICCLISVSVYLTEVGFLVMLVGLPCDNSTSWAAPTTSSTSPATGCLPAHEGSAGLAPPTSPNSPSSG